MISIGSGSLSGKGIGKGEQKSLQYLPPSVSMNDFIFCVLAEETGFVGTATTLGLFTVLLLSGLWTAVRSNDDRGRLVAIGVMTLVFVHIYINIAMSIGLMPITGLPLPFISAGKTFLVTLLAALGIVQSCMALGPVTGSLLVTVMKPAKDSIRMVLTMCCLIFLMGIGLAVSRTTIGWCLFIFLQYLFASIMNVHWNTVMRSEVPLELLGRVYSTRDTIQNGTIPLGIFLGGWLADRVFTPLMTQESALQKTLLPLFGAGRGAGMAVLFLLVSVTGLLISVLCASSPEFRQPKESTGTDRTEEAITQQTKP